MSSATPSSPVPLAKRYLPPSLTRGVEQLAEQLQAVAFWSAVLLPFLFIPVLQTGIFVENPLTVVGLLAFNVVCAVVGHGYAR